ncbi:helix-turn-helix domain-containing protein [Pedobacter sp. HMF7647]|uniref:Helix-turn-helix domain-containing protein n=1 Tax=Hufsiella arboris TaxID=2695275 RepID=A0A7K1YFA0_9SPHI|nr:helix-turn-helix domain-containing protein [Hufsiella arboris]MXV53252.1 helix-turn-helix domain-containing protein [Hufsiella arboris]
MSLSYLSLFFFTASQLGLLISGLLLWPRKNFRQNVFLSLAIFSLAICSLYNFCFSAGIISSGPVFFTLAKSLSFLIAPCSFLYIRNILYPNNSRKKYQWVHFAPFFAVLIYCEIYRLTRSKEYLDMMSNSPNVWQFYNALGVSFQYFSLLKVVIWFIYGAAETLLIINYERRAAYSESVYDYKLVNWLKTYNLLTMILYSSLLTQRLLNIQSVNLDFMNETSMSLILIVIALWLIFQPHILYGMDIAAERSETNPIAINGHEEYIELSDLSPQVHPMFEPDKRRQYLDTLNEFVKETKPFLKKGYLIKELAEAINIPVHQLSYLINTEFNLHFQDFMNLQRIEYLKERINDPELQQLSLEGMAWEVGFKSRTTFFRAFIKFTGHSPSEYFGHLSKPGDAPSGAAATA